MVVRGEVRGTPGEAPPTKYPKYPRIRLLLGPRRLLWGLGGPGGQEGARAWEGQEASNTPYNPYVVVEFSVIRPLCSLLATLATLGTPLAPRWHPVGTRRDPGMTPSSGTTVYGTSLRVS